MNANELAEYYSLLVNHDKLYAKVVEQQAEIEALKKEAALQRLSDFTQEADNEPVAWMFKTKQEYGGDVVFPDEVEHTKFYYAEQRWNYELIPLYTHPAKTLTDEEILKMAADKFHYSEYKLVIDFARAILRKAQEK